MSILVAGGGQLGGYIASRLRQQGLEVYMAGRSVSTSVPSCKVDLCDHESVKALLEDIKPECIIVTAFDFTLDEISNVLLIDNLLRCISDTGTEPKIIYFSSCAEYGTLKLDKSGFSESDAPNPISKYGEIKAKVAEHLASRYELLDILRIFNLYSRNMPPGCFVGRLWEAILANDKSEFEFSYYEDVRDYFNFNLLGEVVENLVSRTASVGIVNVCSGTGIRISDLAREIVAKSRRLDFRLVLNAELPYGELPVSVGLTEKMELLGVSPKPLTY